MPSALPDWVHVEGVTTPQEALRYTRAASIVIAEGTSTMHEAAALRTPSLLIPGTIQEATLLAQSLAREGAGEMLEIEAVTAEAVATLFREALSDSPARSAMTSLAHDLVTSGGGAMAAAKLVLEVAERQKAARRAAA
ncbi:glycosyltransferase [Geminicoccus harenae]|uniref:glycosyltransferase n=1 Tax=Geminicoccus harenae TaxID=2498453 RepID=UPI00168B20AA|nr:glycosyltransferase [Geminicoccus harenae]